MDHATARRQLAAAQARYDAMEPEYDDAPECDDCGAEMTPAGMDSDGETQWQTWRCETCESAEDDAAEAMDGDHETALASVYGGES